MKRLASLLIVGIAAVLTASIATATPSTFEAILLGSNENPANASPGTGLAVVYIDPALHFMEVTVTFSGLLGNTTAAHIHCCAVPPANAGVATAVPFFPGFPIGVTSGTYDMAFDTSLASTWNPTFVTNHGGTVVSAEAAFFAGMFAGETYFNIHTNVFPGGEIRGVLVVPEPATVALLGVALAGLGFARRRPSPVG